MRIQSLWVAVALFAVACGDDDEPSGDAAVDARDTGRDGNQDAREDAAEDAPRPDVGGDAAEDASEDATDDATSDAMPDAAGDSGPPADGGDEMAFRLCENADDCTFTEIADEIRGTEDCPCLFGCPYLPVNEATAMRRQAAYDAMCTPGIDGDGNDCPVDDCAPPPTAICNGDNLCDSE